jgi:hypothetical protein
VGGKMKKRILFVLLLVLATGALIGMEIKPSIQTEPVVWVTPSGKKYHTEGCRTIQKSKNLISMTKTEAIEKGYDACKICCP